jgi:hypothetical protein
VVWLSVARESQIFTLKIKMAQLQMDEIDFEKLLEVVCERLTRDVQNNPLNRKPNEFEKLARIRIQEGLAEIGAALALDQVAQGFPDIVVGRFGAEVKATESDSWRCIANSVSEGQRAQNVDRIYVIYGKMGGKPEVKWADYGKSIVHVRTSHVPRFEIEIGSSRSLFELIGTTYEQFRILPMLEKMPFIREYARARLKVGERLWWLEDKEVDDQEHSLPLNVRIYMDLEPQEKRNLRAEAALLCPMVVGGSRKRKKYTDAVSYLMTYRGVLCPQARDLFSAGSVAGKARGGNYVQRALIDIQDEMRTAACALEAPLFVEYWGSAPEPESRLKHWLSLADGYATSWKPSKHMFLENSVG